MCVCGIQLSGSTVWMGSRGAEEGHRQEHTHTHRGTYMRMLIPPFSDLPFEKCPIDKHHLIQHLSLSALQCATCETKNGQNCKSPSTSVQQMWSTLEGHSATPLGTNLVAVVTLANDPAIAMTRLCPWLPRGVATGCGVSASNFRPRSEAQSECMHVHAKSL